MAGAGLRHLAFYRAGMAGRADISLEVARIEGNSAAHDVRWTGAKQAATVPHNATLFNILLATPLPLSQPPTRNCLAARHRLRAQHR